MKPDLTLITKVKEAAKKESPETQQRIQDWLDWYNDSFVNNNGEASSIELRFRNYLKSGLI